MDVPGAPTTVRSGIGAAPHTGLNPRGRPDGSGSISGAPPVLTVEGVGRQCEREATLTVRLLHLNTPILRNPLTLLSVFTPLISSTLAAFLPQLGS